ncbi:MAG: glycosyltransferase family 2 protein, partial [Myxococcales bacterium]|nr:glycosyltransferase family 2 protein [Myxococcales bacterium]
MGSTAGSAQIRCAVVVVNYRTPDLARAAVESALAQIDRRRDRIVLVDNASGDDSLARLRGAASEAGWGAAVEIVASPRNGGFAAGNELGLARVRCERALLLNSDARLEPGALDALHAALDARPDVGIAGPRIVDGDGRLQQSAFRYRTPLGELVESVDLGWLRRLLRPHDPLLSPSVDRPSDAPEWLSFACVLVRAEVFARVGPLDDGYFLYFEDLDFCRRAREAGWRLLYEPAAVVVHDEGRSSSTPVGSPTAAARPAYYYEARARYFARFYGRAGL